MKIQQYSTTKNKNIAVKDNAYYYINAIGVLLIKWKKYLVIANMPKNTLHWWS